MDPYNIQVPAGAAPRATGVVFVTLPASPFPVCDFLGISRVETEQQPAPRLCIVFPQRMTNLHWPTLIHPPFPAPHLDFLRYYPYSARLFK